MNLLDFEVFSNYNTSYRTNDKIQFRIITSKAKAMADKKVYSSAEIEELLISDGHKESLVKEAIGFVLGSKTESATSTPKVAKTSKMPQRYSDIAQNFEEVLMSKGPNFFVKSLTEGESPLVKISKKETETFRRIADLAYENPVHFSTLHAYIKPSIASELAENVCRARKIKSNCGFKKINSNSYQISHKGKTVVASSTPVNSTSEKFSKSSYGIFGFPDEYVILAHEESDPMCQIKKDLN
jgi:hypothetical protein